MISYIKRLYSFSPLQEIITQNNRMMSFLFLISSSVVIFTEPLTPASCSEKKNNSTSIGLITIENKLQKAKPIISKLLHIAKNPTIKGLIIHIDCGGGRVGTSQVIFSEIKKLKQVKPVIVVIENTCCSGAYYIATAADFIFGLPSSDIGGIGCIAHIEKRKNLKFSDNEFSGDVEMVVFRGGEYKGITGYYVPLEKKHIAYIKQNIEKDYKQFVCGVAQARNLSIDDEKIWADGKIFVGTEALQLGLIDAIGDFTDALAKMKELLSLRGIIIESELEVIEI